MRRGNVVRTMVFVGLVMMVVLGMASAAFAATITQTPNFNGATLPKGVPYTINWTSSGVDAGLLLVMRTTTMSAPIVDTPVAVGLDQSGSFTVVPDGVVGSTYCFYLVTSDGTLYSDAAYTPWKFTLGPAPVVSTPAFSPWSIALAMITAIGLIVAVPSAGRRRAGS
jgi:hypothetical protein